MTQKPDGGPAFPPHLQATNCSTEQAAWWEGMTLRDYFAGQALVGLITGRFRYSHAGEIQAQAYVMADAMLAERAK